MCVDLPLDKKTVENQDWATGPLGLRAAGPSRAVGRGPMGLRAAGPSRAVGRGPLGRGPLGRGPAFSKTPFYIGPFRDRNDKFPYPFKFFN